VFEILIRIRGQSCLLKQSDMAFVMPLEMGKKKKINAILIFKLKYFSCIFKK
jgi:hypothetical protein